MLIAPYDLDGFGHDAGRAPAEEATKAAVVLGRPSIGEAGKAPSGSGGSASPSIQAFAPPEEIDPIEVSFDLSP